MKLVVLLAVVAAAAARPDDDYSRYDNFNVDEIIDNTRLLTSYVRCFLSIGKCTPEGSDFKKWIPEAVQTKCGKCSENQKTHVAKMIKAIMEKLPEDWGKLNKIHNAKGKFDKDIKEFVEQYAQNKR